MIYALDKDSGKRIEATETGQRANCPGCGAEVLSKCGEHMVKHWAHVNSQDCDDWYEPMSAFHMWWQSRFPKEWREVTIKGDDGTHHRADILIPGWGVVEVQHSPISSQTIREREQFYKRYAGNICWIVDAREFAHRFVNRSYAYPPSRFALASERSRKANGIGWDVLDRIGYKSVDQAKGISVLEWKRPRKSWFATRSPVVFDTGRQNHRRPMYHVKGEQEYRDTFMLLFEVDTYDTKFSCSRFKPIKEYWIPFPGETNPFTGGPDGMYTNVEPSGVAYEYRGEEIEACDDQTDYLMGGEFMHRNRVINGLKARAVYPEVEDVA